MAVARKLALGGRTCRATMRQEETARSAVSTMAAIWISEVSLQTWYKHLFFCLRSTVFGACKLFPSCAQQTHHLFLPTLARRPVCSSQSLSCEIARGGRSWLAGWPNRACINRRLQFRFSRSPVVRVESTKAVICHVAAPDWDDGLAKPDSSRLPLTQKGRGGL